MINVKRFILHVSKKDPDTNEVTAKRSFPIRPSNNENELRMKEDLANKLLTLKAKNYWTHYYVVCEIETPEGTRLYRTVVGIHMF